MSSINLHTREINVKVVYYGPGLGGKTTSLQHIHKTLRPELRGKLVSLATGIDRTLYFDFLPIKLPKVRDFNIRMSLYTVPGQVHYNATRKLVLQGCDGVVFVADSQPARREANIESLRNLETNLQAQGISPQETPLVFQYNKRDLAGVMDLERMDADLNPGSLLRFPTCALTGMGIFESLKSIAKLVLRDLKRKGIYQDKPTTKVPEFDSAPIVNPNVERGIVQVIERQQDREVERGSAQRLSAGQIAFSRFWPQGAVRDQIADLEGRMRLGDFLACVQQAGRVLEGYVGHSNGGDSNPTEVLLMLGIYGPYYARFRKTVETAEPNEEDALFCLFFLADVELRMQAVGLRSGD